MISSFRVGPLNFQIYGMFLLFAVWAGLFLTERRFRKVKEDPEELWRLSLWVIPFGIFGARIYHLVNYFEFYRENPGLMFAVWDGGMGIFGALLGGLAGLFLGLLVFKKKINFARYLDLLTPAIPLAQAIGRFGNYFNRELFGSPTNLPWGIYIPYLQRPQNYLNQEKFHPLFFYESAYSLLVLFLLLFLEKKFRRVDGSLFFLYLLLYGVGRFLLEGLRLNNWKVGGVAVASLFSLGLIGASLGFFVFNFRKLFPPKIAQ
ncbi:prolipoprotein diacylglyceryl transferase [candidate division WWE3 bacterium CG_4_10_14_0_2_um_filter_42_7]|uniref:Phosphatidylglycerol--prolipoprotein diacylglyceryl transferase n=2 Tax=Katanobacteria TaxID=422282 RepID=A0A2H0X9V6_UNCKA|nr:MAG: prolipoprotein diacylglyceryl transferase [candidate division WWE3 bacterium CG08_land_8_20_14_0_20_41_15]PIZ42760.1 MAG: prolipoprotein diacylglyceryl transferase [candidate division WWE3 bacterium CG_4_10_14_0_2_um_filter_42_7]